MLRRETQGQSPAFLQHGGVHTLERFQPEVPGTHDAARVGTQEDA